MARFTDLPNEIVAMIAENVLPGDIVDFSATSKNIQSLSEPSLRKHNEMKRKYESCDCTGSGSPLSNLLYEIVQQPTVALYVESLTIDIWFDCWDDDPVSSHPRYLKEKMERLKEAAAGFLPSDQVLAWVTAIESGDEDPILALLLLQLPNIAALTLIDIGMSCQRLFQTLTRTLDAPGVPLLSNLTDLEINWDESESDASHHDWQAINNFAKLPSLRSIIAWNICIDDDDDDSDYILRPRSSNVSTLVLLQCSIGAQRLYEFLEGIRALKRFSYEDTYRNQDPFDTFWIRVALLAHAKVSLEYLSLLRLDTREKRYMGSLRDFEKLTEIHTDLTSLVKAEHSGHRALEPMLPVSVENVHIHGELYDSPETIQDLILGAANDKHELLPNLSQLHVSLYMYKMSAKIETMIASMKTKCENAGFELIID